ncbi:MAG: hypothetical protein HGA38_02010 [Candidatus Moranbacteria bacterium]|nr:hypothetical protein [Candidatus Moranbacteria bacterium]
MEPIGQDRSSRSDFVAILVGFGLVIAISAFFLFRGNGERKEDLTLNTNGEASEKPSLPTISVAELRSRLVSSPKSLIVADLRSADAFRSAHAAGSSLSSVTDIGSLDLPDDGLLILVPSGVADSDRKAADAASSHDTRIAFLANGLADWQSAGGAIVTDPNFSSPIDRSKVTLISPADWKSTVEAKETAYRVLDARESDVSATAPVQNAINIPYENLESRRSELPAATNIALCAGSPDEAFRAGVRLFDLGFYAVRTLDGSCSDIAK